MSSKDVKRATAFGPPSEWCDHRCGRCVLDARCEAAREERERRSWHEQRGEDPDDVGIIMGDVVESLTRALEIATQALRERGDDPDAPIERPPESALSESVHEASLRLVLAADRMAEDLPWWIGRLLHPVVSRMAAKAGRLTAFVTLDEVAFDEVVAGNAYATVLLLERLDEQVAAVAALGPIAAEVSDARAHFWRVLQPLRAQVPPAARDHLARLVERGRAPSPFFIRPAASA